MDGYILLLPVSLIFLGIGLVIGLQKYDRFRMKGHAVEDLDQMSGFTFEKYLKVLFEELGYEARVTPDRKDFGADLIVVKDGVKTAVQAKRYKGSVGISAVQQVVAAKLHYKCNRAMVVTTSPKFTPSAWKLAKSNYVWLINRTRLQEMIRQAHSS